MSGFEVAGILLGAFPLMISGLEHWRDVAKVSNSYWRIRKEYSRCRSDVQFYEIWYKRNLKELLLPIMDPGDVENLVKDPGGKGWCSTDLEEHLRRRLQESYSLYMDIICEMNETALEMKKQIASENVAIQNELIPPVPKTQRRSSSPNPLPQIIHSTVSSAKSKFTYGAFRIKFSFNGPVRQELFDQLKDYNERLEKLLSTSDKISSPQHTVSFVTTKRTALEQTIKAVSKKSDLLFKALEKSWQCACQKYHSAHLRLEHRASLGMCFEIILTFISPLPQTRPEWAWREINCIQMTNCSVSKNPIEPRTRSQSVASPSNRALAPAPNSGSLSPPSKNKKKVAFMQPSLSVSTIQLDTLIDADIKLCQALSNDKSDECIGIIGHDDEEYHLHPFKKREPLNADNNRNPITLDYLLSRSQKARISRRQRYSIALLLASSVAQLQSTAWLKTDLTKQDIFFFPSEIDDETVSYHEPFIHRDFLPHLSNRSNDAISNTKYDSSKFYSLGIMLLELCFDMRLEDSSHRKNSPSETADVKHALDLMAALKWAQSVNEEGGDDYASAVKWCFTGSNYANQSWRSEMIKNVIRPLEICQEHFKAALGM
ncbi:hypothetical protein GGR58DRAFT_2827 [Xylaria digitata]|nr:hypothetical protein GGR58DRAFT_2827 [Xylaria digitata]